MAMSMRSEEKNPFFCDEDEDHYWSHTEHKKNQFADDDNDIEQIRAQISKSNEAQLKSLQRSRIVVAETEDIANKTAEELLHQGEQLNNAEQKLDSISAMTRVTQRNLNSIKSVFGGIKNWFQQKSDSATSREGEIQHSRLQEAIEDNGRQKPRYRRSELQQGMDHYEDEQYDERLREGAMASAAVDDHLSEIGAGVQRLKLLSLGMKEELHKQDQQLDRLVEKTDKNDLILKNQNKQMKAMLR